MNGLRSWERDAALLEAAGDGALVPPGPTALAAAVAEHLTGGAAPSRCTWTYARWKPGVALACAYELEFDGHGRALVVLKRRADDKGAGLVAGLVDRRPEVSIGEQLRARPAAWAAGLGALWLPVGDPRLPGLALCEDRRALRRVLDATGNLGADVMRRRATRAHVLRYRPERRAVWRLDLALRTADGAHRRRDLALRCLPPAVAERVVARRRAFGDAAPLPRLVGHDARRGLLVEDWLDVVVPEPDAFAHVDRAGALLAWLHGRGAPADSTSTDDFAAGRERARELLAWHDDLAARLSALPDDDPTPGPRTWTHGDLHPDQVARGRVDGRDVLLDLDELGPGDPDGDLASWIADHLAERADRGYDEAAGPLLAAYERAGDRRPDAARVRAHVRAALVQRAAAACRRLERDALSRARDLLDRALTLTGGSPSEVASS